MGDEVPKLSTNRSPKSKLKASTIPSPWSTGGARAPPPKVCLRCTYLVPLLLVANFTLGVSIFAKTIMDNRKAEEAAMTKEPSSSTSINAAALSTTTNSEGSTA